MSLTLFPAFSCCCNCLLPEKLRLRFYRPGCSLMGRHLVLAGMYQYQMPVVFTEAPTGLHVWRHSPHSTWPRSTQYMGGCRRFPGRWSPSYIPLSQQPPHFAFLPTPWSSGQPNVVNKWPCCCFSQGGAEQTAKAADPPCAGYRIAPEEAQS